MSPGERRHFLASSSHLCTVTSQYAHLHPRMYLSKLELHGFKSFADKTVLDFSPGITAIVGPNGCGKSNIVDAVRWVIGEQRARVLRSDTMSDVIFNGTANRKPVGMSEVQLTVENTRGVLPTEYSEVQIGRRLYRSGDSDYLMNGVQSRLRDIQELFMDTGMGAGAYSVIELKMVDEILSGSAEDRRHMFEEAAGITKYKQRRSQALRKLDNTQQDLTRIRDLTDEVEKTVRRLKRQAKKTRRHRELSGRLSTLELALSQAELDRLQEKRRTLQRETDALQQRAQELTTQLDTAEAELEARRKEQVDREQAFTRRQEALNRHIEQVRTLETDRRLERERLDNARREQERVRHEQRASAERRDELDAEIERLTAELTASEPALEQARQALADAERERDRARAAVHEQQERLRPLRARERQAEDDVTDHRRALDRLTNRIELLERDRERLAEQNEQLDEAAGDLEARGRHARRQLEEADAEVQRAQAALQQAESERESRQQTLDDAQDTVRELERQRDTVEAEVQLLESLVASYEEFPDAVQFLATDASWHAPGDLQTVADVLGCDDAHRLALDAALGDLASCIIVEDEDAVRQALGRLRSEEKGRATFLILDRLNGLPGPPDEDDHTAGIAPLRRHVRVTEDALTPLADLLLHDCYFAETPDEARRQARIADHGRFIAASGEWIDAGGLEHGGSTREAASPVANRFGRREQLEKARETLARVEDELSDSLAAVDEARTALHAVEHEEARQRLDQAERAHREAEQARERVAYEQDEHHRRRTELENRVEEVNASLSDDRTAVGAAEEVLQAAEETLSRHRAEREEAEKALQSAEATARAAVEAHNAANLEAVQRRNQHDTLRREVERVRQARTDLQQRREERSTRLTELQERIAAAEEAVAGFDERLKDVQQEHTGLDEAVHAARNALTATKSAINDIEHRLRGLRRERDDVIQQENERNVRLAQVETRAADLLETVAADYERDLMQQPVELPEGFEEESARTEVRDLRAKIKKLGSVNPLALEEYEEEKGRLDFLVTQREDLEQAEDTLLDTITEINATASARFEETYEAIRTHFKEIFARLFGEGASADLELEDPDDPLDAPIEIRAQPRGKRPSVLTQLSSGEKTLTAIALLFAIYLVKPSPFCILDEVDAPLDDMNVERFMRLIDDFSDQTQFIIVTHNKLTMEAADTLYGVTMQEQGVSQLVGVHFDEAAAMTG